MINWKEEQIKFTEAKWFMSRRNRIGDTDQPRVAYCYGYRCTKCSFNSDSRDIAECSREFNWKQIRRIYNGGQNE